MKLTILTTLLTISLVTAAFSAEEAPPASPQPTDPAITTAAPSPSSIPTPTPEIPPPAVPPAPSPSAVTSPSITPSLFDAKQPTLDLRAAPIKLGYVDLSKIFQESKPAKKADEALQKSRDKFKKQLMDKRKKLEALEKSLQGKASQMNQLEKETKAKEFQAKVIEFQEAGQKAEKELAKQAEEVNRRVQEKIVKTIKEYGEKQGYALIAAQLLYSDGNHKLTNVTDDVIKILDK